MIFNKRKQKLKERSVTWQHTKGLDWELVVLKQSQSSVVSLKLHLKTSAVIAFFSLAASINIPFKSWLEDEKQQNDWMWQSLQEESLNHKGFIL